MSCAGSGERDFDGGVIVGVGFGSATGGLDKGCMELGGDGGEVSSPGLHLAVSIRRIKARRLRQGYSKESNKQERYTNLHREGVVAAKDGRRITNLSVERS